MADGTEVAAESAQRWRDVRALLTAYRYELGRVAARLYPGLPRAGSADLLCREEWLPPAPLGLDDLPVTWAGGPPDGNGGAVPPTGDDGPVPPVVRYDRASAPVRPRSTSSLRGR